jgi:hypothetical protein
VKHSATFLKERDTKNTTRYAEQVAEDQAPIIGTIYVQKWVAKGATEITVVIETPDDKPAA